MEMVWPGFLGLLGLVPLLVVVYVWVLRRRRRYAVRYSSLALVREALPHRSWLRRHLPFLLFLFGLGSLVIALGRPVTSITVLSGGTTIILTIDVSRSMCSTDIPPTRLEAAKAAALSFVRSQVSGVRIGIVAFAGFAELAQQPTADVTSLENTIRNLTTATRTAIGSAILRSLDAIAEVDESIPPSRPVGELPPVLPENALQPRFAGDGYAPHIIVLLTDGASNSGPPPLIAARQAVERGIRIYPIGFGTAQSSVMNCGGVLGGDLFGGATYGFATGGLGSEPDEMTLKKIAEMTGGIYYSAASAAELQFVFQNLRNRLAVNDETIEVSVFFAAAGALAAVAALILSLFWNPLP